MNVEFVDCKSKWFSVIQKIRNDVFELEQGANANEEFDYYDSCDDTVFALVFIEDEPVATGRIVLLSNGYKIGRIAVLKTYRGYGLGKMLVTSLCEKAYQMGATEIYVDSQLHAVGFYEKLGFEKYSDSIVIDRGLQHLPMIRRYNYGN